MTASARGPFDELAGTGMRDIAPQKQVVARDLDGLCLALVSAAAGAQVRPGAAERAKELNQQAGTAQQ